MGIEEDTLEGLLTRLERLIPTLSSDQVRFAHTERAYTILMRLRATHYTGPLGIPKQVHVDRIKAIEQVRHDEPRS